MNIGYALHPHHARQLVEGSGIDPEVVAERGYYSLMRPTAANPKEPSDHLKKLKISNKFRDQPTRFPGVVIPVYDPTGARRGIHWRSDNPGKDPATGKPLKYAMTYGQPAALDVHPRWSKDIGADDAAAVPAIRDIKRTLWITEGVKKGDALTSRGCVTVALAGVFNWRSTLGTLGDWEDIPLRGRTVVVCFDSDAKTNANIVRAMQRLGGWLKSKGAQVRYVVVPTSVDGVKTKGVDDYLVAGGTLEGLHTVSTIASPSEPTTDRFSDARLADVISEEVLDGKFIWTAGRGWLEWTGTHWSEVHEVVPTDKGRQWTLARYTEAVDELEKAEAAEEAKPGSIKEDVMEALKLAVKGWYSMLSRSRLSAVMKGAAGTVGVYRDAADLDQDPDILNALNGIVHLPSGELLPHDPAAMCSKLAPTNYVPGATHPDWDKALQAVPADVVDWLKVRYGQAITGHMTPDDMLPIQQGGGSNGKTTVLEAVCSTMGDYYGLLSDRVILANPDAHPTELMDLQGMRFAALEETPEARRLNVTRLKKVIGTPQITARRICKDDVTFDATHSLFVNTNFLPEVAETDIGTWRRLALVKFPYTFKKTAAEVVEEDDRLGDPTLRERVGDPLVSEAVLAWLVEGAMQWENAGRVMPPVPPRVVADTKAWRTDSDVILAYLEERMCFDAGRWVTSGDFVHDFNVWVAARGGQRWSEKLLSSRLAEHHEMKTRKVTKRKARAVGRGGELSRPAIDSFDSPWKMLPSLPSGPVALWVGVRFAD